MKKVFSAIILSFLFPLLALAQVAYQPLISIKGISDRPGGGSFSDYIGFLYGLSIAIAALLAVIKIIIAGVKYMLSASVGAKGNAKSEIQGSLLGLLLILGAFIILNTINPTLTNGGVKFQPLPPAPEIQQRPGVQVSGATGAAADAAASTTNAAISGGCNKRTTTQDARFTYISLDFTGCQKGFDPAPYLGVFSRYCTSVSGGYKLTSNKATCSIPRAGIASTQYGTLLQQAGTWTKNVVFSDNGKVNFSNQTALIGECQDKFGTATILNKGSVSEQVKCTFPAVITYSGSESQFAAGDCSSQNPPGQLIPSSSLKLGFGVDFYCVIKK